jgi:hypothetical protein
MELGPSSFRNLQYTGRLTRTALSQRSVLCNLCLNDARNTSLDIGMIEASPLFARLSGWLLPKDPGPPPKPAVFGGGTHATRAAVTDLCSLSCQPLNRILITFTAHEEDIVQRVSIALISRSILLRWLFPAFFGHAPSSHATQDTAESLSYRCRIRAWLTLIFC